MKTVWRNFKGKVGQMCHRSCSFVYVVVFLYKVEHKIGRLWKFNSARRNELKSGNCLEYPHETWYTCSSCIKLQKFASDFLILPKGIVMVFQSWKNKWHINFRPTFPLKFFMRFSQDASLLLLYRLFSHNVVAMETSAIGWPPWLVTYWYLWIFEQLYMHMHLELTWFFKFRVSKYNQSKWPSNCTGFHGHHIMWNSSIPWCNIKNEENCGILR